MAFFKKSVDRSGNDCNYFAVDLYKVNASSGYVSADIKGWKNENARKAGSDPQQVCFPVRFKLTETELKLIKSGDYNIVERIYSEAKKTEPFFKGDGKKEPKAKDI